MPNPKPFACARRPETSPRRSQLPTATGALRVDLLRRGLTMLLALAFSTPSLALAEDVRLSTAQARSNDGESSEAGLAEALAGHPASARRAALVAAGHPEDLLAIEQIQLDTASRFADLVSALPRSDQEQIWNLVRHPELAAELARDGHKSIAQLEAVAERYPPEDREAIVREGRDRHALWVQIYALDLEAKQRAARVLAPRPPEVRTAFAELERRPDLLSLLIENIHWTTLLGADYRQDPTGVEARFEVLEAELTSSKSEQERAWAAELNDPAAADELDRAAREFAEEYDYDYSRETDDVRDSSATTTVYVARSVYVNPYPYWFGYPYWYDVAFWYPISFWHHVGFRYGYANRHRHAYVQFGLPSPLFLGWYHNVYSPRHHARHHAVGHRDTRRHARYYDRHRPSRSVSRHASHVDFIRQAASRRSAVDRSPGARSETRAGRSREDADRRTSTRPAREHLRTQERGRRAELERRDGPVRRDSDRRLRRAPQTRDARIERPRVVQAPAKTDETRAIRPGVRPTPGSEETSGDRRHNARPRVDPRPARSFQKSPPADVQAGPPRETRRRDPKSPGLSPLREGRASARPANDVRRGNRAEAREKRREARSRRQTADRAGKRAENRGGRNGGGNRGQGDRRGGSGS